MAIYVRVELHLDVNALLVNDYKSSLVNRRDIFIWTYGVGTRR